MDVIDEQPSVQPGAPAPSPTRRPHRPASLPLVIAIAVIAVAALGLAIAAVVLAISNSSRVDPPAGSGWSEEVEEVEGYEGSGEADADGFVPWDDDWVEAVEDPPIILSWQETAAAIAGDWTGGERSQHLCPAGGRPFAVWGTDLYTHDSSICTAAVHAGLIDLETGGAVWIELLPGRASYVGSDRNGVQTEDWGEWPHSFQVVEAAPLDSAE